VRRREGKMNPQTVAFSSLGVGVPFLDPATGNTLYLTLPSGVTLGSNPVNATPIAPASVASAGVMKDYAGTYQVIPTSSTVNY
jgi:hypothetical protein